MILLVVMAASLGLWFTWAQEPIRYCRLQFGTEGDGATVLAGVTPNVLRLYRSGRIDNSTEMYSLTYGKLPAESQIPSFTLPNGDRYTITQIYPHTVESPSYRDALLVDVRIEKATSSVSMYCDVQLKNDVATVKTAEFDGPLAVRVFLDSLNTPRDFCLTACGEPNPIACFVGIFDDSRDVWTVVDHDHKPFTDGLRPTVTIEYPTEGDEVTRVLTVPLSQKKCRSVFYDKVILPADAVPGTAKVTVQIDDFAGATVCASTVSVPVVNPKPAGSQQGHPPVPGASRAIHPGILNQRGWVA